jgi:hypothetical protein
MAERREMSLGMRKAIAPLAVLALLAGGLAACGSGDQTTTTTPPPPPVSASTADHLASLSDRVATELDAGQTCDAAYAADQLKDAVNHADLSASLRPAVEQIATRLVDEVNCPPPPPAPEPEKKPKKPKHEGGDENKQGDSKPTPPGHGGTQPPGHAKLKGE